MKREKCSIPHTFSFVFLQGCTEATVTVRTQPSDKKTSKKMKKPRMKAENIEESVSARFWNVVLEKLNL